MTKLTGTNTVSVLATLLLLSYVKLLITAIAAVSFTRLSLLNGKSTYPVWVLDPNIRYFFGKHASLFLMSLLMIVTYILPFTMIITLGPILQAKTDYKVLRWINRIRPFLDAFYGPYTDKYRYWPGLLLLIRLILLSLFAFYSLGDGIFKLVLIAVAISLILIIWLMIGKTQQVSLHRNSKLNYLELFFHLNLSLFTVGSIYLKFTKTPEIIIYKQQSLALVMVGSVFVVFCGIIVHQILQIAQIGKRIREVSRYIQHQNKCPTDNVVLNSIQQNEVSTHTTVEINSISNTLREPLLNDL